MARSRVDALVVHMVALAASVALLGGISFVPTQMMSAFKAGVLGRAPRSGAAEAPKPTQEGGSMTAMLGFATVAGVAVGALRKPKTSKIMRRYTTEVILPKMEWLSAGFGENDLEPGEIRTVTLAGLDIAVGKTEGGKVFAVGDKAPPTGISLSQGGYVEGNNVVEAQYGSKFDAFSGDVEEWCPYPPLLGAAIGAFMGGPTMIATFNCRGGGNIQVEVDTNARKAYEADYWKGLLDAQGKNDGTYY